MSSKLTPEVHEKIVRLIRAGNYRETACAAAGIWARTMRTWLRLGSEGLEPYAQFAADIAQAEAEAEARDVALIAKAGTEDWKAAAWRLERKVHDRWARRDRPEVTMRAEDPKTLTREQLVERIRVLAVREGILPPDAAVGVLPSAATTDEEEDDE